MFSTGITILEAIIGFGVLIFVHELGHFLACKWIGVRVEIFSLGFGPALKKKWGETEYRLSVCPLGGYVKMAGEEPNPEKPPRPDEFYAKSVGQRSIVFVSGVVMNLLFGFVAFMLAYRVGVPVVPAIVGGVEPGSSAWNIGLRRGDVIERIQGVSPPIDFEDLRTAVTLSKPGQGIHLTVSRNGHQFEGIIYPQYQKELGMPSAGIYQPTTMEIALVPKLAESGGNGEADFDRIFKAGLKSGDVITAVRVAGREERIPVPTPQDFQNAIDDSGGEPVRIFYRRGKSEMDRFVTVTPEPAGPARWLGVRFGSNRVSAVRSGSWSEVAGIRPGDVIISIGDTPVRSRHEAIQALDATAGKPGFTLEVRRGNQDIRLNASLGAEDDAQGAIAFDPSLTVDGTMRGYPAQLIGLQPGDEIISANDTEVKNAAELAAVLLTAKGNAVSLAWRRDGQVMRASAAPQERWVIALPLEPAQKIARADLVDSCLLGARKAYQWALHVYAALKSLIFGRVSARHLSGPISIGYLAYAAAKRGLGTFLYILGVLNINLGIMNLLPIPVLDGGHLLFAAIEKARGRPVNERARAIATYMGLALLIGLLLVAFWNDIQGLILG